VKMDSTRTALPLFAPAPDRVWCLCADAGSELVRLRGVQDSALAARMRSLMSSPASEQKVGARTTAKRVRQTPASG